MRGAVNERRVWLALAGVLLLMALGAQAWRGWAAWGADLAAEDDPAHFVTGVMVYDYLRGGNYGDPMGFAEAYYVRYPKVALGHWPPGYYGVQAAWYFVFGPTDRAARTLTFVMTLGLAGMVWWGLRGMGGTVATLGAAGLLVMPLTQELGWRVMADIPLALFVMLMVLALTRYLETDARRALGWFVLWAVLAILTKGSGWAVGIFAVLAPVLSGRVRCLWRPQYLGAGVVIVALGAPFYLLTWWQKIGYADNPAQFATGSSWEGRWRALEAMTAATPAFVMLFVVGMGGVAVWRYGRGPAVVPVALGWVVAQWAFLVLFPLTTDTRYLMPALGPAMIVFGAALREMGRPLAAVVVVVFCVTGVRLWTEEREEGYGRAATLVPRGVVAMVVADPSGAGAFIAARLQSDREREDVVLRDSKSLANTTWGDGEGESYFRTPAEVDAFLQSVPVEVLAVDSRAKETVARGLLRGLLASSPERYVELGRVVLDRKGAGEMVLYRNVAARGRSEIVEVNLGREKGNRVLRLRLGIGTPR